VIEAYQRHPLEVRVMRLLIVSFGLFVLLGVYYVAGGPVPHLIVWGGPEGAAFRGSYLVSSRVEGPPPAALAGDGRQFEARYPYTVMVWAPRTANVVAAAEITSGQAALKTISVRRAGVVCTTAYRYGTDLSAVCK